MFKNTEGLKNTLDISINTSNTINGHDDPNFLRIRHNNHHIVLYIKDYILKEKCKTYVEIGTHFGHSLCNILQSKYYSKLISIDLFLKGKTIAKDCLIDNIEELAHNNAKKFNKNNYDWTIIKGNSYADETVKKVKNICNEGIDLLFIDGDHSSKGVKSDFEKYFPLVNSGGYIVFDDYLPLELSNGKKRECPIAVNEIIEKYKDKIEVIGLIDDIVKCNNKIKTEKNIDFIIKKK